MFKKFIALFLALFLFASPVLAMDGRMQGGFQGSLDESKRILSEFPSGLTFYENYESGTDATSLNAAYSVGSPTATFTASRPATTPATCIDSNGVIQLTTTSNIPRFAGGYYDETGFHSAKGLMIEAAGTNLLKNTDGTAYGSGMWTNWDTTVSTASEPTKTNVAITDLISISGATSERLRYTGVPADVSAAITFHSAGTAVGSVVNTDVVTLSFYIRSQTGNTGVVIKPRITTYTAADAGITDYDSSTAITTTTSWQKVSYTITVTDATSSFVRVTPVRISAIDNTDLVDIEVACPQLEKNPYPTSFIPTTTAALTRDAEVLKYPIAGNRTAATETIAIKFMPLGGSFANDGIMRFLTDTDTKRRLWLKSTDSTQSTFYPNLTDSSGTDVTSSTAQLLNTSYVDTVVCYGETAGTNAEFYTNGESENTDINNYTAPAWGTYFYLGSDSSGATQLNGLIQSVAIHSRVLNSSEVLSEYGVLK
jgi:hypothetical protein